MMKMANEIARKVSEEKAKQGSWRPRGSGSSDDGLQVGGEAPPAYVSRDGFAL